MVHLLKATLQFQLLGEYYNINNDRNLSTVGKIICLIGHM